MDKTITSGKVREALASVLEQPEYLLPTPRNVAIRDSTKKLLETITAVGNIKVFENFSKNLVTSIQSIFPVSSSASATDNSMEKLLSAFHKKRISELEGIWQFFFEKLGWQAPDPMISQYINQTLFDSLVMNHFGAASHAKPKPPPSTSLTVDEDNILRYVSGYIPFKLLRQFEKQTTDKAADFVECLSHMAVPGTSAEEDFPTYATKWIQQVNRGGLFVVNDRAFDLFRRIEIEIRDTLPTLLGPNPPESQQRDAVVSRVTTTEEIQEQWALLAVDIDDDNDAQELLRVIVNLWITIRAHALAKSWMECYRSTKKSTSKAKGLRKSLKKTDTDTEQ